jgi:hypothetical protein
VISEECFASLKERSSPVKWSREVRNGGDFIYSYLDFKEKESIVFLCKALRVNRKKRTPVQKRASLG